MKRLILCLMLSACAFDPEMVRRSGIRRAAGSRLASCLDSPPGRPFNERACLAEQREYCRSKGMEENCGVDDAFWIITDRNMQRMQGHR